MIYHVPFTLERAETIVDVPAQQKRRRLTLVSPTIPGSITLDLVGELAATVEKDGRVDVVVGIGELAHQPVPSPAPPRGGFGRGAR